MCRHRMLMALIAGLAGPAEAVAQRGPPGPPTAPPALLHPESFDARSFDPASRQRHPPWHLPGVVERRPPHLTAPFRPEKRRPDQQGPMLLLPIPLPGQFPGAAGTVPPRETRPFFSQGWTTDGFGGAQPR